MFDTHLNIRAWRCNPWGRQCDQLLLSGYQIFTPGRQPGPQDRWLSSLGKRTLMIICYILHKLNPLVLKYNFWRPEYLFWRPKMKTWGPAGPKIFFWKWSTEIVTVLHVVQVMCMHSVRTVHKFTKDFLLQYLFSQCDKLLSKGGEGG